MKSTPWYIGRRRLQKLADHLEHGKLSVKKFDFSVIRTVVDKGTAKDSSYAVPNNFCGTLGCAIGELPRVFPRDFLWTGSSSEFADTIKLKKENSGDFMAAAKFFGLVHDRTTQEAYQLFAPQEQYLPCLRWLLSDASKREVAQNIKRYIKWRDKEEQEAKLLVII